MTMLAHKRVAKTSMASGVAGFTGRPGRCLNVANTSCGRQRTVRVAALKDATPLRQQAETAVRQAIKDYQEAYTSYPKVRFVLVSGETQMGEVWRLVGSSPELGRWVAEIGVDMTWQQGGKWMAEVKLPPGEHVFKCLLRRGDGSYQWEGGANRVLQVREGAKLVQVDMLPQSDEVPSIALVAAH